MAADFFLENPSIEIPSLQAIAAFKWHNLGSWDVQYAIGAEEQYLAFHMTMLQQLRHTKSGHLSNPPYKYELGLSVRAGAVKAAVLISASILEAALRSIAESRGYPLNADPRRRTFGNVIRSWETDGQPRHDVAAIWPAVKAVHEVRNFVHLHKAANSSDAEWENVLKAESKLLEGALAAINHVSQIAV